jgi:PleD family two-component response regulator
MRSLNQILERNGEQWVSAPVKITVSFGVCGFESMKELGAAIEQADQAMYTSKQTRQSSTDYPD